VVGEVIDLADAVGEHLVGGDEILGAHAGGVGQRQRRTLDRPADRPPDVHLNDAGAARGELRRLGGPQHVSGPARAAQRGVIDVHTASRAARAVAVGRAGTSVRASRGIEDDHFAGAQFAFHQALDFPVVVAFHGDVVVEVGDGGRRLAQHEALAIQRQRAGQRPQVGDGDLLSRGLEKEPRCGAGQGGAVQHRLVGLRADEGERRADAGVRVDGGLRGKLLGSGEGHGGLPIEEVAVRHSWSFRNGSVQVSWK
jgi:hypothetical protein